jgi:hypothetical protein
MFRERGSKYVKFMMDENDFYRGIMCVPIIINNKEY